MLCDVFFVTATAEAAVGDNSPNSDHWESEAVRETDSDRHV